MRRLTLAASICALLSNVAGAVTLPPISNGLVYHLDAQDIDGNGIADVLANGSAVSTWVDKAAANNAVVGASTTPVYIASGINGNPVVRFDTTTDRLTSPTNTTWGTVFAVTSVAGGNPDFTGLIGDNNSDFGIRRHTAVSGLWRGNQALTNAGDFTRNNGTFLVNGVTSDAAAINTPHLISATHGNPGPVGSVGPQLGGFNNGAFGREYLGDYGEIVIYDRAMNWQERHAVESYLGTKWGLAITPTIDERVVNAVQINTETNFPAFPQGEVVAAVNFHNNGAANALVGANTINGLAFNDVNIGGANVTNLALTANSSTVQLTTNFSFFHGLRQQNVVVGGTDGAVVSNLLRQVHAIGTTDTAIMTFDGLRGDGDLFVQLLGGDENWGADLDVFANGQLVGRWTNVADANTTTGGMFGFYTTADALGSLTLQLQAINVGGPGNANFAGLTGVIITQSHIPEPATVSLLLLTAAALGGRRRRQRNEA